MPNGTQWIADLNKYQYENVSASASTERIISAEPLEFRATMHVLYAAVFALSLVGNSIVMHVSLQSRSAAKSSYMLLIFNLAVCDSLTPMISVPFDIAQTEIGKQWLFGPVMCSLLWPCQTLFSTSSSFTLGVICYDRYRALTKPFLGPTSFHKVKVWIALIHIVSSLLVMPYLAVLQLEPRTQSCQEEWPKPAVVYRQAYTMLLFLVQYAVPLLFMIVLYSIALFTLFSSSSKMFAFATNKRKESQNPREDSCMSVMVIQRRKRNLRVTKMFILVVVVFAIGMFPNQVLWLWSEYANEHAAINFGRTAVICRLFTYSNSVLNPLIYCFCSREYRAGFKIIGLRFSLRRRKERRIAVRPRSSVTRRDVSNAQTSKERLFAQVQGTFSNDNGRRKTRNPTSTFNKKKAVLIDRNCTNYELEIIDFVSKFDNTQALLEHFKSLPESSV